MKGKLCNTVWFILTMFSITAAGMYRDVIFDHTRVTDSGIATDYGFGYFRGQSGEPNIPIKKVTLLLPPDADLFTVTVQIRDIRKEHINGHVAIPPNPPCFTEDRIIRPRGRNIVDGKDRDIYGTDAWFPENPIRHYYTGKMRQYNIVDIHISPYQYNPVTRSLVKITRCRLDLQFDKLNNVGTIYGESEAVRQRLRDIIENDAIEEQYRSIATPRPAGRKTGYAIMIPSSIKSASSIFNALVDSKKNHGYAVTVVTENEWGATSVEAIRGWLKSNYLSMGIEYVLLIGNPTGNLPMQRYTTDYDDPLSDIVYGDLSGNPDRNGNGRYGEFNGDFGAGGLDKYTDVHVGRIPNYGNIQNLDNILTKIIDYENETDIEWRKKAYFAMHIFSDAQNGYVYGHAIEEAVVTPNAGWTAHRVYDAPVFGCLDFPPSYTKVVENWNKFDYGIFVWQAHGMPTFAEDIMSTSTAANLGVKKTGHGYQTSCNNAKPAQSDNLAYAILKHAAVSTIGYSEVCIYSAFNTDYGSGGMANDYGYVYARNLVNRKLPAGAAISAARDELPSSDGGAWQNFTAQLLYGCPDVGVFTSGDQTVSQETIKVNNSGMRVTSLCTGSGTVRFTISNTAHDGGFVAVYNAFGRLLQTVPLVKGSDKAYWYSETATGVYFFELNLMRNGGGVVRLADKVVVQ